MNSRISSRARHSRINTDVENLMMEGNQDLPQTIRLQLRWNEQQADEVRFDLNDATEDRTPATNEAVIEQLD